MLVTCVRHFLLDLLLVGCCNQLKPSKGGSAPSRPSVPDLPRNKNYHPFSAWTHRAASSSSSPSSWNSGSIWIACGIAGVVLLLWVTYKLVRKEMSRRRSLQPNVIQQSAYTYYDAQQPSAKFWKSNTGAIDSEVVCTICLCGIDPRSEIVGQSACCRSWFHRNCTAMYWASVEGVKCPNCRHEVVTA